MRAAPTVMVGRVGNTFLSVSMTSSTRWWAASAAPRSRHRVTLVPKGVEGAEPGVALHDRQRVFAQQRHHLLEQSCALVLPDGDKQRRVCAAEPLCRTPLKQHVSKAHLRFLRREVTRVLRRPGPNPLVDLHRRRAVVEQGDPDRLARLADEAEVESEAALRAEHGHNDSADAPGRLFDGAGFDQLGLAEQGVHSLGLPSAVTPGR